MSELEPTTLSRLKQLDLPRYASLPQSELYRDQVVQYINEILAPVSLGMDCPLVTRAMVSNYTQHAIVKSPVKKRYTTSHLAYLIVVCLLKPCYSLKEISALMQVYYEQEDARTVQDSYDQFVGIYCHSLQEILENGHICSQYYAHPDPEQVLLVNVISSVVYKICTLVFLQDHNTL